MRQASWNEMFVPRPAGTLALGPEVPREPQGWRRLFWWEDLLTFALLGVLFLAVIGDVDRANWAEDLPTLFPVAFFGLFLGALLARVPVREGFLHLLALALGVAAALGQVLLIVDGPSPVQRFEELTTRMGAWFSVAANGGVSNDELPFIVLVVPLAWLVAYASAWAVFRWRNVWLGLIPGGLALLMNISFLPGQFSYAFVVYLLAGTLLITRMHLMERAAAWRSEGTPYPSLLSLAVLHATFWLALLVVVLAWLMPQANEAGAVESVWRRATAPVSDRIEDWGRLFVGVDGRKQVRVHDFEELLPLLGSIDLPSTEALDVRVEPLDQPGFLRALVYDRYVDGGWRASRSRPATLDAGERSDVDEGLEARETQRVEVRPMGENGDTMLVIGQPLSADRETDVRWVRVLENIVQASASDGLRRDAPYEATGSVSVATEEQLRAAGEDYPSWVTSGYLQTRDIPAPVRDLARSLTADAATPYDKALALEAYLRAIPYDLDVPEPPRGVDPIEHFLFDGRRGYFDYHASAMVLMLRSTGVPSRLAVGYVLRDSELERTGRYTVTEESAFAWAEVYFPGLGWIDFNPTPNLPSVLRAPPAGAGPEDAQPLPPEPSDLGLEGLPGAFGGEGGEPAIEPAAPGGSGLPARAVVIGVLAGLAALALGAAGGARYAWARGLSGLEPVARRWEQTVRLAGWAGLPARGSETPREYARMLRERSPGLSDAELLADAYVRRRFGRQAVSIEEQGRIEQAWRVIRGRLLRRLARLG